jgi:oxepin-CoA hydrolase/3-oxo-5,6-dehydrosuberyl-CoA semialdehyde dehydrogenase
MSVIPFDVNDPSIRDAFLARQMFDCIDQLSEKATARWGNMTPQHMVEHLLWAFECSTETLNVSCSTPAHLLERAKRFLFDNRHTPHEFKNPLLGLTPPPFRFASFAESKTALQREVVRFYEHIREQPEAIHIHPIFGPLSADEMHRSHFKHCYHHLVQFGLIGGAESADP